TDSLSGTTDSAAAATAISTGQRVQNGRLNSSVQYPQDYETLLQYLTDTEGGRDYLTGVISKTTLYHATPAGFIAHEASRGSYADIASDIIESQPDLLMGGGSEYLSSLLGTAAQPSTDRSSLPGLTTSLPVVGLYSSGYMHQVVQRDPDASETQPTLPEMASAALAVMQAASAEQGRPFALVIEASFPDHGSHANNANVAMTEVIELHEAVRDTLDAIDLSNTLLLVTADHETGKLDLNATEVAEALAACGVSAPAATGYRDIDTVAQARQDRIDALGSSYSWGSGGHTSRHVLLAGSGPGSDAIGGLNGWLGSHKGTAQILRSVAGDGWTVSADYGSPSVHSVFEDGYTCACSIGEIIEEDCSCDVYGERVYYLSPVDEFGTPLTSEPMGTWYACPTTQSPVACTNRIHWSDESATYALTLETQELRRVCADTNGATPCNISVTLYPDSVSTVGAFTLTIPAACTHIESPPMLVPLVLATAVITVLIVGGIAVCVRSAYPKKVTVLATGLEKANGIPEEGGTQESCVAAVKQFALTLPQAKQGVIRCGPDSIEKNPPLTVTIDADDVVLAGVFAYDALLWLRDRSHSIGVSWWRRLFFWVDFTKGKEEVNVTRLDARIGVTRKVKDGDLYLANEGSTNLVGGCISLILHIVGAGMVGWTIFATLRKYEHPLDLPKDLYGPMRPDEPPCLRERYVETVPYSSLDVTIGKYLGSDWGAKCLPTSASIEAMSFTDKTRLIFSTSAGTLPFEALPSLGVGSKDIPTTVAELRSADCVTVKTSGCNLMGGAPCSATYTDPNAVSLSWAAGYPSFTDMTFNVMMRPASEGQFTQFGLDVSTVRTHVFPATFNQYLITDVVDGQDTVEPLIKGPTALTGLLSVRLGWWQEDMAYPRDDMSEEDEATVRDVIVPEIIASYGKTESDVQEYTDLIWNPFVENKFLQENDPSTPENDVGRQDPLRRAAMWDAEREIHSTVGPLPTIAIVADNQNPANMCTTRGVDDNYYFHGGLCEVMIEGDSLPDYDYVSQQPDTVLCGTQQFSVESQMLTLRGWCKRHFFFNGDQDDPCPGQTVYYASLIFTIESDPSVCLATDAAATEGLSVSLHHTISDQVTSVKYDNLRRTNLLWSVLMIAVGFFSIKTALTLLHKINGPEIPKATEKQRRLRTLINKSPNMSLDSVLKQPLSDAATQHTPPCTGVPEDTGTSRQSGNKTAISPSGVSLGTLLSGTDPVSAKHTKPPRRQPLTTANGKGSQPVNRSQALCVQLSQTRSMKEVHESKNRGKRQGRKPEKDKEGRVSAADSAYSGPYSV
ncbi:LOW QUALITY PROTEIN: alkaline phosphatase, partial [Kipferlia bialata]